VHTYREFLLKLLEIDQPAYEITLMLSRVSWALAQISCLLTINQLSVYVCVAVRCFVFSVYVCFLQWKFCLLTCLLTVLEHPCKLHKFTNLERPLLLCSLRVWIAG